VETAFSYVIAQIPLSSLDLPSFIGLGLTGINEKNEAGLLGSPNQKIIEGRSYKREKEVIAGEALVADYDLLDREIKVGDKLTVPVGTSGKTMEIKVVGIFETGSMLNNYALIGKESLARKISQISDKKASEILVRVGDPNRVGEIAEEIEAFFEKKKPAVSVVVPTDVLDQMSSFTGVLRNFLLAIALVAAVAGGTAVTVVMLLTGFERKREFGVLKASGWSNFNIVLSVFITSLTLALLGSLAGLSLGIGVTSVLSSYVEISGFVSINLEVLAWAFGVGFVTGVLGGIFPAASAARVAPMETLRAE
jgi:putative ABC transport system permease protein